MPRQDHKVFCPGDAQTSSYVQLGHGGNRIESRSVLTLFNYTGNVTLSVKEDINFTAGNANSVYSQLGHGGSTARGSHSGLITITQANDLTFKAGNQLNAYSQLGHGGVSAGEFGSGGIHTGIITITRANDLTFMAGNGINAYSQLGHGGRDARGSSSGLITITQANDLTLMAGDGGDAYSQLGHGGARADGNRSGEIDVTLVGDLTLTGVNTTIQYALVGHGDEPEDLGQDQNNTVAGDVSLRAGGNVTLTNAFLGHLIDNNGTYTSGNTLLGVRGDLTADANSQVFSAAPAQNGELRFYVAGDDLVNANTLLNGVAHGGTPFPNDQGKFGFGDGPYTADPANDGNFAYYGLADVFNYTVDATEATNIADALATGDVTLAFNLDQPNFGAEFDWDGGTQFITINSDVASASTNSLSLLTTGDITLDAVVSTVGALTLQTLSGQIKSPAGVVAADLVQGSILTINGVLSPGGSPGQLPVQANILFSTGDTLNIEIDGTTAGTEYDQLVVTGTIDLGGATLNLSGSYNALPRDTFTIIDNDAADPVIGTFAGLPGGSIVELNGERFQIFYDGGDGNDVVLSAPSIDPHGILLLPGRVAGNVIAYRSGQDLIVIPDSDDNGVLISSVDGDVVVTGLGGTTINGQASFTAFLGTSVLPEDLMVVGSAGRDLLTLLNVELTGSAILSGGNDVDSIFLNNVDIGGTLRINEDAGDGFIEIIDSEVSGVTQLNSGSGNNAVVIDSTDFGSFFSFTGGTGQDDFSMSNGVVNGATQIRPGNGDSNISIANLDVAGSLYVLTGSGQDAVTGSNVQVGSTLYLSTGAGDDVIDFDDLDANSTAIIQPGTGNDQTRFQNSEFGGLLNTFFAGGNNVIDLNNNRFAGPTYIQTFSGALAARLVDNVFSGNLLLRGGSGSGDVLIEGTNTYNGAKTTLGFEDLTNDLIMADFEDLLGLAFP